MFSIRNTSFNLAAVFAVVLVCLAAPGGALQKGKGGGGGGGGGGGAADGTVYYIDATGYSNRTWSMDADGANKTMLGHWAYFTIPSTALHGGHRWFITVFPVDGTYPDGVTGRRDVFAFRDDYHPVNNNNEDTRVRLTDDAELEPSGVGFSGARWVPGDIGISFRGRKWVGGVPLEGGLYTADVAFDGDGNLTGLTEAPVLALLFDLNASSSPTLVDFSWDPTGTRVVYTGSTSSGLWVADLSANTRTQITTSGSDPDWSPAGDKIVFDAGATINTVKPNGKSVKTVLRSNTSFRAYAHPSFSPTGSHIVCLGLRKVGYDNDVVSATASGDSLTNLTDTPDVNESPIGWR